MAAGYSAVSAKAVLYMGISMRFFFLTTFFKGILAVTALLFTSACSEQFDPPPFPDDRSEAYEYYKLEWLSDGFPGRRNEDGQLIAHPIYGTYVIRDYIRQYKLTNEEKYLEAAKHVADAAIARMDEFNGALVYWYTPDMGFVALEETAYSGLTQGRYLDAFGLLWTVSRDKKYFNAAERVLASLAVPVSEGGVLRERPGGGAVIEEWPERASGHYVLNGWTTAMVNLDQYIQWTDSEQARILLARNVEALHELLPLFDREDVLNSSYRLAGSRYIRIDLRYVGGEVLSGEVGVPGEGYYQIGNEPGYWMNHWQNERNSQMVKANIVLNYISAPKENNLRLKIKAEKSGPVKVWIQPWTYNPLEYKPRNPKFELLNVYDLEPGIHELEVAIPWETVPNVAYPTNFRKQIGGKKYNVYHYLHIKNLQILGESLADPVLLEYANRWQLYADQWNSEALYSNAGVELEPVER